MIKNQVCKLGFKKVVITLISAIVIVFLLSIFITWLISTVFGVEITLAVTFGGSVVVAIFALLTILITVENNDEIKKLETMPSLLINFGREDNKNTLYSNDCDIHFHLIENEEDNSKIFRPVSIGNVDYNGKSFLVTKGYWIWKITIVNVGNGVAHNIKLNCNNQLCISHRILAKNAQILVYVDILDYKKELCLQFNFEFEDLLGNKYNQEHYYHSKCGEILEIRNGMPQMQ